MKSKQQESNSLEVLVLKAEVEALKVKIIQLNAENKLLRKQNDAQYELDAYCCELCLNV